MALSSAWSRAICSRSDSQTQPAWLGALHIAQLGSASIVTASSEERFVHRHGPAQERAGR
jgi:hypothetical protein